MLWEIGATLASLAAHEARRADIAPPNSRDSIVVYGTFLENNSSNVCNLLKVVTSSTLSFQNRFLLDTTRTCSHSVIFFKSLRLRNPFPDRLPDKLSEFHLSHAWVSRGRGASGQRRYRSG
jgi:hypothetical protein